MELNTNKRSTSMSPQTTGPRLAGIGERYTEDDVPAPISISKMKSIEPEASTVPVTMPASAPKAADDIARIGVEGRPADAKSGPGMLIMELGFILVLVAAVSIATGLWVGWGLGLAMFIVGSLALMCNPVIGATAMRTKDRQVAAEQEQLDGSAETPKRA